MALQFELPVIWQNYGKPPKKRGASWYPVRSTGSLTIREAGARELDAGLTFVAEGILNERPYRVETPFLVTDGRMVRPVSAIGGAHLTKTRLEGFGTARLGDIPENLRVGAARLWYGATSEKVYDTAEVYGRNGSRRDLVEKDGYAVAMADLQSVVDHDMLVVDGVLFETAAPPTWSVQIGGGRVSCGAYFKPAGQFDFPADCGDEAREFARTMGDALGLPVDIASTRSIEVDCSELPLCFAEPLVIAASRIADSAGVHRSRTPALGVVAWNAGLAFRDDPTSASAMEFAEALASERQSLSDITRPLLDAFAVFQERLPARYRGEDFAPIDIYGVGMRRASRV